MYDNLISFRIFTSNLIEYFIHFDLEMYIHNMYKYFLKNFIHGSCMSRNY